MNGQDKAEAAAAVNLHIDPVESPDREIPFNHSLSNLRELLNDFENKDFNDIIDNKNELFALKKQFDRVLEKVSVKNENSSVKETVNELPSTRQGAIPKRKSVLQTDTPSITSDSVSSNLTDSEGPDSSDSKSDCSKVKPKNEKRLAMKKPKETNGNNDLGRCSTLLMRQAPRMQSCDESSGIDLKYYLEEFEVYCRQNFNGLPRFWKGELESKLSGETLQAYHTFNSVEDSWETLVKKLSKWYSEQKVARRSKFIEKFDELQHAKRESLFMLATRIEKTFKVAYPDKSVDSSKTLRNKFISCMPSHYRHMFESYVVNRKMKNKRVQWESLKKMARVYEAEKHDKDKKAKEKEKEKEEIVISVGSSDRFRSHERKPYHQERRYPSRDSSRNRVSFRLPAQRPQKKENGNRQRSSSFSPRKSSLTCYHCRRPGHVIADCRVKHNLCFSCGGSDHLIRDCREKRPNYRTNSDIDRSSRVEESAVSEDYSEN